MVGLGVMVMHGGDWQRGECFRVVELALRWSATLKNPLLVFTKFSLNIYYNRWVKIYIKSFCVWLPCTIMVLFVMTSSN